MDPHYWMMTPEQLLERAASDAPSEALVTALADQLSDQLWDHDDAATRIEQLEAEVEQLTSHKTFLEEELEAYCRDLNDLQKNDAMR